MKPRVVIASAQGETIHIKSKQTGRVILRLKLRPMRNHGGVYELLIDKTEFSRLNEGGSTVYTSDLAAGREIDRYEGGKP